MPGAKDYSLQHKGDSAPSLQGASEVESFLSAFTKYGVLLEERCAALEETLRTSGSHSGTTVTQEQALPKKETNLDPLTPLLEDASVDDIMVNGPDAVYFERAGTIEPSDIRFASHEALEQFTVQLMGSMGLRMQPERPFVDARLPDGSRVNIVLPPLSVDGISISIRKIGHTIHSLDTLVQSASLSKQMAEFLKVCASVKLNIVVAGGTGAGKTTMLNSIANHIRPTERIVTIENPSELRLLSPNVVRLEWVENHTALQRITPRDLVKNALRMRPDRIIVGEVRGAEAFDMMQAMNTGHEGSLTTIHANTPRDCLGRIENMISMADLNLPPAAVRKQIATAIHLIVQIMRFEDGVRRVTKITEVVGMESDMIVMQDVFTFKQSGIDEKGSVLGQHLWSGIYPKHHELNRALRDAGMLTVVAGLKV